MCSLNDTGLQGIKRVLPGCQVALQSPQKQRRKPRLTRARAAAPALAHTPEPRKVPGPKPPDTSAAFAGSSRARPQVGGQTGSQEVREGLANDAAIVSNHRTHGHSQVPYRASAATSILIWMPIAPGRCPVQVSLRACQQQLHCRRSYFYPVVPNSRVLD